MLSAHAHARAPPRRSTIRFSRALSSLLPPSPAFSHLLPPSAQVLKTIYHSILSGHLSSNFSPDLLKLCPRIVDATLMLHKLVADSFLPTAVKFHYQWNLRELSRVFQVTGGPAQRNHRVASRPRQFHTLAP